MINTKLLELQKEGIKLERDGTNPHFRSSYVTLNEVLAKVKPSLSKLNIVIVQTVGAEGLTTNLIDTEDGTSVWCFVPFVGATDMQKLGGAITYARRYSLISLLGLEDEDDDGESASKPAFIKKPAKAKEEVIGVEEDELSL